MGNHLLRSQIVVIHSDNARLQLRRSIAESNPYVDVNSSVANSAVRTSDAAKSGVSLGKNGCHLSGGVRDKTAGSHTYDKAAQKWNHYDADAALAELSDDEGQVRLAASLIPRLSELL